MKENKLRCCHCGCGKETIQIVNGKYFNPPSEMGEQAKQRRCIEYYEKKTSNDIMKWVRNHIIIKGGIQNG